jgi:hypothetical protein
VLHIFLGIFDMVQCLIKNVTGVKQSEKTYTRERINTVESNSDFALIERLKNYKILKIMHLIYLRPTGGTLSKSCSF